MAFTQTDLVRIQTAIARGELMVSFSDRTITYRSIDDLLKAEARIATALTAPRARQTILVGTKGT